MNRTHIALIFILLSSSIWVSGQDDAWSPAVDGHRPTTVANFLISKVDQLHQKGGAAIGSTLFYGPLTTNAEDRLLLLPGHVLLIGFIKDDSEYWISVKIHAPRWKQLFDAVLEKPMTIFLENPVQRPFSAEENAAITQLVNKVKEIYGCRPPESPGPTTLNLGMETANLSQRIEEKGTEAQLEALKSEELIEIIRPDGIYLISSETGVFIYRLHLRDLEYRRYIKNGSYIVHDCPDLYSCKIRLQGSLIIADLSVAPERLKLTAAEKVRYGIGDRASERQDNPKETQAIAALEKQFDNIYTCPRAVNFRPVFTYDSLMATGTNTYLFAAPESESLSGWILLTKQGCHNCFPFSSGLFSAMSTEPVQIERCADLSLLSGEENSELQQALIENLQFAFHWADIGLISKRKILFLGDAGFTYRDTAQKLTFSHRGRRLTYAIPIENSQPLNRWLNLFSHSPSPIKLDGPIKEKEIHALFEEAAMGIHYWVKRYRQNPIAFLAQYCELK